MPIDLNHLCTTTEPYQGETPHISEPTETAAARQLQSLLSPESLQNEWFYTNGNAGAWGGDAPQAMIDWKCRDYIQIFDRNIPVHPAEDLIFTIATADIPIRIKGTDDYYKIHLWMGNYANNPAIPFIGDFPVVGAEVELFRWMWASNTWRPCVSRNTPLVSTTASYTLLDRISKKKLLELRSGGWANGFRFPWADFSAQQVMEIVSNSVAKPRKGLDKLVEMCAEMGKVRYANELELIFKVSWNPIVYMQPQVKPQEDFLKRHKIDGLTEAAPVRKRVCIAGFWKEPDWKETPLLERTIDQVYGPDTVSGGHPTKYNAVNFSQGLLEVG